MRSVQTFRKKWNTVLRLMRSICVPCNPSAKRTNNHSAGMRSNAFRATLPQISKIPMRSYAFRLSSYAFLLICLNIRQKSHAFLCVPAQLWHEIERHKTLPNNCIDLPYKGFWDTAFQMSVRTDSELIQILFRTHSELVQNSFSILPELIQNPFRIHSEITQNPFRTHSEFTENSRRTHSEFSLNPFWIHLWSHVWIHSVSMYEPMYESIPNPCVNPCLITVLIRDSSGAGLAGILAWWISRATN